MDKNERLAKARAELLGPPHRDRLVRAFGEDFERHPGFDGIVEEVAGGRYPQNAIFDRTGR